MMGRGSLVLALACAGLACAFDPTGVTLDGTWDASDGPGLFGAYQFSLTEGGDSVFGTMTAVVPYYSLTPDTVTFNLRGTHYAADIVFMVQGGFDSRPMRARLTAADRFVLKYQGVDFVAYETYRRHSP